MKSFAVTLSFALASALATLTVGAQAQAWTKVVDCGDLVVDRANAGDLFPYQMVFRGAVLTNFLSLGAVAGGDVNNKGEYILPIDVHASQLVAFKSVGPSYQFIYRVNIWNGDVSLTGAMGGTGHFELKKASWDFHNCSVDPLLRSTLDNRSL